METSTDIIKNERKAGRTTLTFEQVVSVCANPSLRNLRIAQRIQKGQNDLERQQKLRVEAKVRAVLYHLSGTHVKVRMTRVGCSYKSLNSGDAFVLDGHYLVYLWIGREANEHEIERGVAALKTIVEQREGVTVKEQVIDEGNETDDFWFILGGKGDIAGANEAVADEIAEGMRDAISPIPSPRTTPPNCAIVGGGVAAGACAKYLCDNFGIQVISLAHTLDPIP